MTPQQLGFHRGEWSPDGWYRTDLEGHDGANRIMRNCFPKQMGPMVNRCGTQYIAPVKDSTKKTILLPFEFSNIQTYCLEFGNQYVRFYANVSGTVGQVVASGIAAYNGSTQYSQGNIVSNGGTNYYYFNATPSTGNAPPNSTYWYALTGSIYEVPTPYVTADLPLIKYTQSADTLYLVHPNYPPATLTRTYASGVIQWIYSPITFGSAVGAPTGVTIANGTNTASPLLSLTTNGTGTQITAYVTAVVGGNESPLSNNIVCNAGATISWTSVPSATAYHVYIYGPFNVLGSIVQMTGRLDSSGATSPYTISNSTSFSSQGSPPSVASGQVFCVTSVDNNNHESLPSNYCYGVQVTSSTGNTISWTAPSSQAVKQYNIYCQYNGIWGFVSTAATGQTSYTFPNGTYTNGLALTPDTSKGIPVSNNPFSGTGNYPGVVAFHLGRLWYASTTNNPQTYWASRAGDYNNFNTTTYTLADDMLTGTILSKKQCQIKWILTQSNGGMFGTSIGTFFMTDGSGNPGVSAVDLPTFRQQDFLYGCADLLPLTVGNNAMYPDYTSRRFRDATYSIYLYGYAGTEIGIRSQHLFDQQAGNGSAYQWAYQTYPYSIAWIVRSDGALIGLSYQKEQNATNLLAWHRHDTQGSFESVCCLANTSGTTDTFFIVNRTINGSTVRCVEWMVPRIFSDIRYAWFVDCGLNYNGTPVTSVTLPHLPNTAVVGLADGVVVSGTTNGSGTLTLPTAASIVTVGLSYQWEFMPMSFEYQTPLGTVSDKTRQIRSVFVALADTGQNSISFAPSNMKPASYPANYPWLQPVEFTFEDMNGLNLNPNMGLFTGTKEITVEPSETTRSGTIYMTSSNPVPVTVEKIVARMEQGER